MRILLLVLMVSFCIINNGYSQLKQIEIEEGFIEFTGTFPQIFKKKNLVNSTYLPSLKNKTFNHAAFTGSNLIIKKYNPQNGVTWVEGKSRDAIHARGTSISVKAKDYLHEVYASISFQTPEIEPEITNVSKDELGITHVGLKQKINGLEIFNSDSYLHGTDDFTSFNGKTYILPSKLDLSPVINEEDALGIILKHLNIDEEVRKKQFDPLLESETLLELGYKEKDGHFTLAYHIEIYQNVIEKWEFYLDAMSGIILQKTPIICKLHNHNLNPESEFDGPSVSNANDLFGNMNQINTYNADNFFFLIDAARPMYDPVNSVMPNDPVGVIWTIDAFDTSPENADFQYGHVFSNDNNWAGQENAVSAHQNAGKAYEYFKNVHKRESINGSGGNIISIINIADKNGNSLENAFWNGYAMFYGSGGQAFLPLARGLDVAAHEIAHGVIQNTANLTYYGESGAINESLADIFGTMVDREDWMIGEDVVKTGVFPSGALRNLQDPHNGAASGDYGNGFQPKHVNEQYQGTADNNGVHINSGIPNHAFYLFASEVGKDKAEQIYYRALTRYLVKSSQFIDLRLAVIQAAMDLDADGNGAEAAAAAAAFDQVGIVDAQGGDYQQDIEENNGNEYLLATSVDKLELFLYNSSYQPLFRLFDKGIINKPSVTDDGSAVLFVGGDHKIYIVFFNWETGNPSISVFSEEPIWRNVVISKDQSKLAALYNDNSNRIFVFDFESQTGVDFELFNPTFTEGIITDNVDFADALEFDYSGNYIMYDAQSTFPSNNAEPIVVWDIGFLNIWNKDANTWALGTIEKLFTNLPEGTSVGNPVFSKNSPYIISFDRRNEKDEYFLMGANIETGELNDLVLNSFWNVPNYSIDDQKIVVDFFNNNTFDLYTLNVDDSKIKFVDQSTQKVLDDRRWGIWFANGERNLNTSTKEIERLNIFSTYPNPSSDYINLSVKFDGSGQGILQIFNVDGKIVYNQHIFHNSGPNKYSIDVNNYSPGTYLTRIVSGNKIGVKLFIKQ